MAVDIKRCSTVKSRRSVAARDSAPARWPFQKNPVPRGRHHSARPPYEVVGANLNRASSARATPPSDGVVSHHADDRFLIAADAVVHHDEFLQKTPNVTRMFTVRWHR